MGQIGGKKGGKYTQIFELLDAFKNLIIFLQLDGTNIQKFHVRATQQFSFWALYIITIIIKHSRLF